MLSKCILILGLIFTLIGTGLLGFVIPKKGDPIKAPNPIVAKCGIGFICFGTFLQMIGTVLS